MSRLLVDRDELANAMRITLPGRDDRAATAGRKLSHILPWRLFTGRNREYWLAEADQVIATVRAEREYHRTGRAPYPPERMVERVRP